LQGHEDLALLESTVRAAGAIACRYFGSDYRTWRKEGGSPVTEADIAVNRYLRETLTAARPGYGWLSEESPDDPSRLSRQRVFVVDPIDGTVAFLKGRPHFTICAAVVADGRPACGAVYNPVSEEFYAARTGAGATRNGVPIHVGGRGALEDCHMLGNRDQLTRPPWPPMRVQNRNSVAYRLALVADGSADASVSLTAKRDWDLAAAEIIACEAGGTVSDAKGHPLIYNKPGAAQPSLVAANPGLHRQIVTLLKNGAAQPAESP
jgi:myo-inositol-1(or 4)-monophosphatase